MTREEAIDLLDNLNGMIEDSRNSDYDTALKMAIKALAQGQNTDFEGMTNGEVIKTMFNPYKICEYDYHVHVYNTEKDFWGCIDWVVYRKSWWDAPYKREEEE